MELGKMSRDQLYYLQLKSKADNTRKGATHKIPNGFLCSLLC